MLTSPVDVSPDHLKTVHAILRENLPSGSTVWVFGSRAQWTTKDSSDLDLAVAGEGQLNHKVIIALDVAFEESELPYTVDIVDVNALTPEFRKIVDGQKVPLPTEKRGANDGRFKSLGECAALVRETASPVDCDGMPYVGPEHMVKGAPPQSNAGASGGVNGAKTRFRRGDVLFGRLHPRLGTAMRPGFDGVCSANILVVRPVAGVDAGFLFHLVASPRFSEFAASGPGGARTPRAAWERASRCKILLPSLPEQRAVARMLQTLDDKIELNRRMSRTLEETARAIFKDWFVYFGPVRAKMNGLWRRGESLPGLPSEYYDAFPDRLEESELGETPEGWKVKALEECFDLVTGRTPSGKACNESGEGMPFFRDSADFGFRYPDKQKFCSAPARIARADETLVGVRMPAGYVNRAWEECGIGRGLAVLRHKSGFSSFAFYWARAMQGELRRCERAGTVSGAIDEKQLKSLPVIESKFEPVEIFDARVLPLDGRIRLNEAENRSLAAQRDALLPKLTS